jgi:hypothetical protein
VGNAKDRVGAIDGVHYAPGFTLVIFKIHTFNNFIHNCNVTHKVITNYKLLFRIKIKI